MEPVRLYFIGVSKQYLGLLAILPLSILGLSFIKGEIFFPVLLLLVISLCLFLILRPLKIKLPGEEEKRLNQKQGGEKEKTLISLLERGFTAIEGQEERKEIEKTKKRLAGIERKVNAERAQKDRDIVGMSNRIFALEKDRQVQDMHLAGLRGENAFLTEENRRLKEKVRELEEELHLQNYKGISDSKG